ncbi:response regulator transcription factor [Agrilactobacillus fermenti]|uniref:response regulator transcription factor n=1 Tax=Agrilactobacillus fermenti TaxID=2586909 RepID=UPI001E45BE97|nr:response regulator transcription factor [Agrilactobacillus fermenti]MCD2257217.1 response regulator transcription factor [Agrilactobacillus fermenti]
MDKILVVDDEPAIVKLLQYNLEQEGYRVTTAFDGAAALTLAMSEPFDFIILDLMLPKLDGLEVTRRLRIDKIRTPIMILTAKDNETDKIVGLELGADDYVTKPFSPREIIARIKAIKRRLIQTPQEQTETAMSQDTIKVGPLVLDLEQMIATKNGKDLRLTPKEFQLLQYFMQRPGRVLSRESLLDGVWGFDYAAESRMVDIQISHLRDKVEADPKRPHFLKTVRGFGYKLEVNND